MPVQSDNQLPNRFEPLGLPLWRGGSEYKQLVSTLEAVLPLRLPSDLAEPEIACVREFTCRPKP